MSTFTYHLSLLGHLCCCADCEASPERVAQRLARARHAERGTAIAYWLSRGADYDAAGVPSMGVFCRQVAEDLQEMETRA